jgi:exodeoxyribonuclease V alpha subunit
VGVVADPGVRIELTEDLAARAVAACRPLLPGSAVPEHIRSLTSDRVLAVEAELNDRLSLRAEHGARDLVVVEGAAGAGKTTRLRAQRRAVEAAGNWMIVVTPTLKAAQVAATEVGASAFSAAWLVHQHGFRWDADGHWSRVATDRVDRAAVLMPGDELVVDEAGMLDQDTARALLTIADETGARLVLLGDRHQLPAVGRGGVLDLALRWAPPEAVEQLTTVHRFADPAYADLSLAMRSGEHSGEVFDTLLERGEIVIHASQTEAIEAIAGVRGLVLADTRDQVTALNAAIRDQRAAGGVGGEAGGEHAGEHGGEVLTTSSGEVIGVGDRVATRRNDRDLGVANRDTWTVTAVGADGRLAVRGRSGERGLPATYAREHVELAYATTVYGAQGETVDHAHVLIGETTGAAAAYVGMTRGRQGNTAHLVAHSVEDARQQWVEVFARDRADLGPAHAARAAADDIDRYGPRARPSRGASGVAALQAAALDAPGPRRPSEPIPGPRPAPDRGIGIGF